MGTIMSRGKLKGQKEKGAEQKERKTGVNQTVTER